MIASDLVVKNRLLDLDISSIIPEGLEWTVRGAWRCISLDKREPPCRNGDREIAAFDDENHVAFAAHFRITKSHDEGHHHAVLIETIPMSAAKEELPPVPQPVLAPLTSAAIFLVACIKPERASYAAVRSLCADLPGIFRAVDFRRLDGGLSCVVGFGSEAWDKLFEAPRPAELHPFREIRSGERHAVSTPADVLFHIRARRMDLCFELVTQIMERIGGAVSAVDETHGFRYFDDRDVLGFVDGTENPRAGAAFDAALVGGEDPRFAGGSYVITQKYLHDMSRWNALPTEEQERIIGRKKLSDIELSDAVKPSSAHNALTTVVENGKEVKILRDNMPFGRPSHGEFGTYFIGYCRSPRITEQMLENMFIGRPPGNYDRLLDFSRAVTGSLFFAPSTTFLENLNGEEPSTASSGPPPEMDRPSSSSVRNTSLAIGSLKGLINE